jgi:hypothetical protein
MKVKEAYALVPITAKWCCSFGYPGQGGFDERYALENGDTLSVTNGDFNATRPFDWRVRVRKYCENGWEDYKSE